MNLIHIARAQTHFFIMGTAQRDLGEDVLIAQHATIGIDIDHYAIHLEQGDHLLHIFIHHQGVGLARRLIDIAAFLRHPVMLQIAPAALDDIPMHRLGMAMARQHAGLAHLEQVHPVAARSAQAQRPKPDILALRHPHPFVVRDHRRDHQFGRGFLGLGMAIGNAGIVLGHGSPI
jgi:hypothetical protein